MKYSLFIAALIFTAFTSSLSAGLVLNPEALEVPMASTPAVINKIDHKAAQKPLEEPSVQVRISEGSKVVHIYSLGFASAVAVIGICMRRQRFSHG